jgi:hypothetical protein
MIEPHVRDEILARLARAEREHDVRILLAVESGSRAWGFASPNSDYDARFIYVHRPAWYLSVGLEEQRDVIEYPIVDDLDINGWDLRKALRLYWKSNPSFVEWVQSPLVYLQRGSFHDGSRSLMRDVYSVESGMYHYRSTAKTTFRSHLQNDRVPLKKYFYVLRPLLAVRWLERFGTPAPIEFGRLLAMVDDRALLDAIDALLAQKRASLELDLSPQVPVIHEFIVRELARLDDIVPQRFERREVEPRLSSLFRDVLREAWA